MTDSLTQVLQRRAERADVAPDVDAMLSLAVRAAEHRGRQRRTVHRAVAASVITVAVASAAVLLARGSGSTHHVVPPAASSGPVSTAAPAPAVSSTAPGRGLDHVAPAPRTAPLAVSLVPHGWAYLAASPAATTYGPPGAHRDAGDFRGKLALMVGERLDTTAPDQLRVAGYPARMATDSIAPGEWIVQIDYSATIELTVQIPKSAHLSRDEAMRLAETLDVRDVRHPASG
jgi:hypothetical protein